MKIVVVGNFGASNLGDELILEGLIKTLREIKPAVDLTVLSAAPAAIKEKFEVRSLYKFPAGIRSFFKYIFSGNFKKTRIAVKECDFFVLGGGGLFDPTHLRSIFIWGIQAFFANFYKKPVIMYGQNLPKMESWFFRKFIGFFFKKAVLVSVRDSDSKENILEMIGNKKIYLMPDLIFKVSPKFKQAKENKMLVCLRGAPALPDGFEDEIAKFINFFLDTNKNYTVEFLPLEKGTDEEFHAKILEKIAEKDRIFIHEYTEDRIKVEKIFSESKIVLGMRLHSILMAVNTGTPFISINYNPKVANILKTLNLGKYLIKLGDSNLKNFTTLCREVLEDGPIISADLEKLRNSQVKKFTEVEDALKKLLN